MYLRYSEKQLNARSKQYYRASRVSFDLPRSVGKTGKPVRDVPGICAVRIIFGPKNSTCFAHSGLTVLCLALCHNELRGRETSALISAGWQADIISLSTSVISFVLRYLRTTTVPFKTANFICILFFCCGGD